MMAPKLLLGVVLILSPPQCAFAASDTSLVSEQPESESDVPEKTFLVSKEGRSYLERALRCMAIGLGAILIIWGLYHFCRDQDRLEELRRIDAAIHSFPKEVKPANMAGTEQQDAEGGQAKTSARRADKAKPRSTKAPAVGRASRR
jgi:hypothetical protein